MRYSSKGKSKYGTILVNIPCAVPAHGVSNSVPSIVWRCCFQVRFPGRRLFNFFGMMFITPSSQRSLTACSFYRQSIKSKTESNCSDVETHVHVKLKGTRCTGKTGTAGACEDEDAHY